MISSRRSMFALRSYRITDTSSRTSCAHHQAPMHPSAPGIRQLSALFGREHRAVVDSLEQRRRDEVRVVVDAFAACEHLASLTLSLVDCLEDVVELLLVDERTDLGLRIGRIADLAAPDAIKEPLPELVVHRRLDVDTTRCGALLACGPERARIGGLDCSVQVGVAGHDQGVVTAELELDALPEGRRLIADLAADCDRAGEGDRANLRMHDERRSDL